MLLDLRKFFVPFPPLHSSCITQDFLTSHIMKSKNIVYLNSFNIIIWSFFLSIYKHTIFITSLSTSIDKPYKKWECIFFVTCGIVFVLFNCPLTTFPTGNVCSCIVFQKLAIFPYSHSNSVLVSQRSVFLWTHKSMSV